MDEHCFALKEGRNGNKVCICLEKPQCPGYPVCAFYKPIWKYDQDRERANIRLRSLPMDQQIHIAETYYEGRTPWLEKPSENED